MKLSHLKLIVISGLIWLGVGFYLLQLGLQLLLSSAHLATASHRPLLDSLIPLAGTREGAAVFLIAIALFIGYFKGRYVLGKSAQRGVARIFSLPNPSSIMKIYNFRYYALLGLMMLLGISIKFFGLSEDIRGFIDIAIGAALLNGAMIYFKLAQEARRQRCS